MTKRITAKGGPLEGKTYLIPERLTRIDTIADAGHYKVNKKTATWQPVDGEATVDDETEELEQDDA